MTAAAAVLGGLGLFLLGMWLMTEGLKLAAGNALRTILQRWTGTPSRGLAAGILITAVVQSSSAVTVATVGFVNAGLLGLSQAVWVVIGTNVGTTGTGWLVALVGVKLNIGLLALPLLGLGMLLRLAAGPHPQRAGIGQALAGFGAFFLGVDILQGGFQDLAPGIAGLELAEAGWLAVAGFLAIGIAITVLTQSSSASIAIILTASATGGVPLELTAAAIIGTSIGTTSTALFAAIGATSPAKRVASAHILFNLMTGAVALAVSSLLLPASIFLAGQIGLGTDQPTVLAVFHTLYKCLGVALVWPLVPWLVRFLSRLFASREEQLGRAQYLDATVMTVPALAVQSLIREIARMQAIAFDLASQRITATGSRRPALARQQAAVHHLGQEIRDFVEKLGTGPLPDDVVEALPDLVRCIQHLEEVAETSAEVAAEAPPTPHVTAGENWEALGEALRDSLTQPGAVEAAEGLAALSARREAAYQQIKSDLLRKAALGQLPVRTMERALLHAQHLRRTAEAATKARHRFLPWRDGIARA